MTEIFTNIGLYHYLILALILFCIGIFGLLLSQNIIKTLLCYELILSAISINFIACNVFIDKHYSSGYIFQLFILIVSIIQIIIALILLVLANKDKEYTNTEEITSLRE